MKSKQEIWQLDIDHKENWPCISLIQKDRTWQYVSVWEMIEDLLRTGGLQIWADEDGVLHIGRAYTLFDPSFTLANFLSISRDESDDYTRNGIAVYGSGVEAFDTRDIDWLGTRKRHGAFAIPEVRTIATAQDLVEIALDEFGSKSDVITCEVEGDPSYKIAQRAMLTEVTANDPTPRVLKASARLSRQL